MENNIIICGDCIEEINRLPSNYIDLVITSPPYNVDLGNNKYKKNGYDIYLDNKEHNDYINWIYSIFNKLHSKIKNGGRICINIGDGKNGAVPTHVDFINILIKAGYSLMTIILWDKMQTSNRAAFGSFCSPSSPSFPRSFEYILIFYKNFKKLQEKGETDLTKEEFVKWSNGIWKFGPEMKMKKIGHPAMFPKELPHRLIKMLSWKNAMVLDPFCGAGTTCLVAKKLGRKFIGFEISKEYCEIANKRINLEI
jgi:site-specific DNA-methyltransferase (adenine-specific)